MDLGALAGSSAWGGVLLMEVTLFVLELARITGVVIAAPVPWEVAPRQAKIGLVILLGLLAHGTPAAQGFDPQNLATLVGTTVLEFATGVAMGMVVRITVAIAEIAGSTVAPVIGFGAAQVFDPMTGESDSVLVKVYRLFGILLALSIGVHRVIVGTMLLSFQKVPVGSLIRPDLASPYLMDLVGELLEVGVRLALPVLAVLLLAQVALGFISRAAPAMQIFSIGFAVTFAVGGVVVVLALPDTGQELITAWERSGGQMERVLSDIADL
jgi:flagellar biosynthesis protein FliR